MFLTEVTRHIPQIPIGISGRPSKAEDLPDRPHGGGNSGKLIAASPAGKGTWRDLRNPPKSHLCPSAERAQVLVLAIPIAGCVLTLTLLKGVCRTPVLA